MFFSLLILGFVLSPIIQTAPTDNVEAHAASISGKVQDVTIASSISHSENKFSNEEFVPPLYEQSIINTFGRYTPLSDDGFISSGYEDYDNYLGGHELPPYGGYELNSYVIFPIREFRESSINRRAFPSKKKVSSTSARQRKFSSRRTIDPFSYNKERPFFSITFDSADDYKPITYEDEEAPSLV